MNSFTSGKSSHQQGGTYLRLSGSEEDNTHQGQEKTTYKSSSDHPESKSLKKGQMERSSAEWKVDWVEYMAFFLTLLTSAAVGAYFGLIKGGQNTISGYLLGGKKMTVVPISISLITAYFSAITILGVPSEVYTHGFNYGASVFSIMTIGFVSAYIVIPVFHKLQLVSAYEYIELRFGRRMRMALSVLFVVNQLSYMPTCIYAPAMAINQATKVNVHLISIVMSGVCIFYTTVGGLKAVVWTDVLQGVVILLSLSTVLIVGTIRVGGIQSVITTALEGGRLEFDFVPGLNKRMDFWSAIVGIPVLWMSLCSFSPESIQRYTALPSLRDAQIAAFVLPLGIGISVAICLGVALIVFAEFHDCDPLSSGLITQNDQLLSLFVLKVCGDIKGLGGLFFAGLVAGSLSTLSAGLNTLAGIIYRDFISPHFRVTPSERNATLIMKSLVCVFGCFCVLLASIIDRLASNLIGIAAIVGGLIAGPVIGIFLLGLLCPWVTNVGVIWGALIGMFSTAWLTVARLVYSVEIASDYPIKPITVDGCYNNITFHEILPRSTMKSDLPYLYRLSPFWLPPLGIIIVVVASVVVSYLTGFNRLEDVNPDLISPLVHRFMPKKHKEYAPVPLEMVELEKNDGSR